jgi:peptidoglycan/xylan/chitin deacetylase (PgdA/CDA1 family)
VATVVQAAPERAVVFTFDDIPGVHGGGCEALPALNRKLVSAIVRNRIPALGLVVDSRSCDNAALYKIWLDAGLELGNHTRSHRDFNITPIEEFEKDTLANGSSIPKMRYFRYPFLRSGTELAKKRAFERFLREHGYTNAPVTIDNDEYIYALAYRRAASRGDRALMKRIAADYIRYMESIFTFYEQLSRDTLGYELPQILLLHDNQINADHLDALVKMVRGRGYRIIPIDEALRDPNYARADGYVGRRGLSWLHRWALDDGKTPPSQPEPPKWVSEVR